MTAPARWEIAAVHSESSGVDSLIQTSRLVSSGARPESAKSDGAAEIPEDNKSIATTAINLEKVFWRIAHV